MGNLDKVMDMQRQGISDSDIVTRLQNEGVSPREIYDSINQARIKMAVSAQDDAPQGSYAQDMQPSIMPSPENFNPQNQPLPQNQQPLIPPQPSGPEYYPPEQKYQQSQAQTPEYYPQMPQAYANQEYYGQDYGQQGTVDTETISEVAEQVASEKINEFKKSVGDINLFKNFVQDKLSDLDERLRRIEGSIDKIHHAVLGKVGEFGDSTSLIHRDLENLHDTVSKLMNPLVDNYNELKKHNHR